MATRTHQTYIRNVSGSTMYFAWLGPNGMTLDDGDDAAVVGSPFEQHQSNPQMVHAIRYALDNGIVEILKTPDVLVNDTSTFRVYKLGATGGSIALLDPDYGSYSGGDEPDPGNDPY